jgi:site-specific DNA recombinase
MTSALIYARVSTEEQGKGYSLPEQVAGAERRAEERGYNVAGIFRDEHTGTELDRPGLAALYDGLRETGASVVLCHDIDRMGRSVFVQAVAEREIEDLGARVEYVMADYASDEGELLKAVKGGIAAYENRQRVERSRRGKNGRARAGSVIIPTGRAPYGYSYVSRPRGGDLVIDEGQALTVRQIYAWLVVNHLSSYEIAKRLYAAGVPSKGDLSAVVHKKQGRADWSPTSIRKIIGNSSYKGVWYWGKTRRTKVKGRYKQIAQPPEQWIAVDVPAIVDPETWERAQECLAENKAKSPRNTKRDYLLQGRIFCTCGRRWIGRYKNHFDRACYRCATTESEPWRTACPSRFGFRQEVIEAAVWRYVIGELLNPENLSAEIERQRAAAEGENTRQAGRLRAIDAELRDVDRKLEILVGQALEGLPQTVIDVHKRALLSQRQELESQRSRTVAEGERVGITEATVQTLYDLAAVVQEAEPHLTPEERKHMLEMLRLRVDVIDQKQVRVSGLVTGAVVDISCS